MRTAITARAFSQEILQTELPFQGERDLRSMAEKARQVIAEADAGTLVLEILPQVISETVYTLESSSSMKMDSPVFFE